ncbi:hypothetical protein FRX31_020757 [Thalictrum thalictroides]|uniref:Uncharacterized protein n=1 Tax=Thalictrum thalictroides TaxID=46969 RepID=A0A7J6VX05_THATH|nr:hypothetical protein FRX31_020757 [Thalictrum thalictroides]
MDQIDAMGRSVHRMGLNCLSTDLSTRALKVKLNKNRTLRISILSQKSGKNSQQQQRIKTLQSAFASIPDCPTIQLKFFNESFK